MNTQTITLTNETIDVIAFGYKAFKINENDSFSTTDVQRNIEANNAFRQCINKLGYTPENHTDVTTIHDLNELQQALHAKNNGTLENQEITVPTHYWEIACACYQTYINKTA